MNTVVDRDMAETQEQALMLSQFCDCLHSLNIPWCVTSVQTAPSKVNLIVPSSALCQTLFPNPSTVSHC